MRERVAKILFAGAALGFLLVLYLSLRPAETTFDVSARTDTVTFVAQRQIVWVVKDVIVENCFVGRGTERPIVLEFTPGTEITVERLAARGLTVHARSRDGANVLEASEEGRGDSCRLVDEAIVRFDPSPLKEFQYRLIFPFSGHVMSLSDAFSEYTWSSPTLTSAHVRLLSAEALSDRVFEAAAIDLGLGDSIHFSEGAESVGQVAADDSSGLLVRFRTVSGRCIVERTGAKGFSATVDRLTRIVKDPSLRLVWAITLFFFGIASGINKWTHYE